jgi:uncharacterized protein (TIGR01741 family)
MLRGDNQMLDDAKVGPIYQQIAQIVIDMIPEEWSKVYVYGEVTEGAQSNFFYYYPIASEEPVYSLKISELFDVDEEEFEQLDDQLYYSLKELWTEFKQSGHEPWSSFTMIIDPERFNIEFGYEDLSAPDTDHFSRSLAWKYHYLSIVPTDSYAKKVLEEYLEKNRKNEEQ